MIQNMPPIRGIHKANSSVRNCKSPFNNKLGVDYLKLHMMEKERVRMLNEKKKILYRLEFIQNRLKEIESYTNEQIENLSVAHPDEKKKKKSKKDEDKEDWKTMSIDY